MRSLLLIFLLLPVSLSGISSQAQTQIDSLFSAVAIGNATHIKEYIKSNADINVQNQDGQTLLSYAVHSKQLEIVNLLLEAGADPNIPENYLKRTPLIVAIILKRGDIIQSLLEAGADVNYQDQEDQTALHHVTRHPNKFFLKNILEKGANPDIQNKRGSTALHYAAWEKDIESIKFLLKARANPNIQNDRGDTALHILSYKNSLSAAQSLLRAGADSTIENDKGETPLDWATSESMKNLLTKASCQSAFK